MPVDPQADAADDLRFAAELRFSYELRETSRVLLSVLKARIEPLGLTLTHFFLLRHLWDAEGINQRELSERLETTQPATVATLDALVKRGLVKRVRTNEDRRMARIFLTAKGKAMRKRLLHFAHELSTGALRGFAPADVALFRTMLAQVRTNLEADASEARGA